MENVGSVLVADATGSGKTRMGAHLTRAVRDRLWSTGRVRRDLTVLVCPPAVASAWQREALDCGITLRTVSQGLLSRGAGAAGRSVEADEVAKAQILAIDEAHNFLGLEAITGRLRDLLAGDPPSRDFDDACATMLERFLAEATGAEFQLLPRLSQRALEQMRSMCDRWGAAARASMDHHDADRWHQLAIPEDGSPTADPHQVATEWLRLVKPIRREVRARQPHRRYSRLSDITASLRAHPLPLAGVEAAMTGLPVVEPLDQRVSACILSVRD